MTSRQAAAIIALVIATATASSAVQAQAGQAGLPFERDANQPFVYLKFDHVGTGVRRRDNEPSSRIWFHFVNNCNVSIRLRLYGAPDGSAAGEVGVMDNVVPDPPMLTIVSDGDSTTKMAGVGTGQKKEVQMPSGYVDEVSGATSVLPGQSVLFSVPPNHVGTKEGGWHMEIPFWFATPMGHGSRDSLTGGEPVMALSYSFYDLPDEARAAISK
jgi:hypothetical protein